MGKEFVLDEIDSNILKLLKQNSRMSYLEMSRRMGIPDATIQFRIKRLKENGTIKNFTITLDPASVGYTVAAIMLVKIDADKHDAAKKMLSMIQEISEIYSVLGEYDLSIKVYARSLEDLNDLINDRIRSIEGIEDLLEIVIVERVKEESISI